MDHYAVMGNPIAHSLSPSIHAAFAEQTAQRLSYEALLVEEGTFPEAVSEFFENAGKGLNVTVPFKQEAWALAVQRSAGAELAGAVNTLFLDTDGTLQGHNTDGIGLVRDIKDNHGGQLAQKDVLILGAGGATRGILLPILEQKPRSVVVANRSPEKAEELAELFAEFGNVSACSLEELAEVETDWLINATSASLQGELPPLTRNNLRQGATCYDLMYGKQPTPFCQWARQAGAAKSLDGLGMLVEQAAESFYLWRGIRPDTGPVINSLR